MDRRKTTVAGEDLIALIPPVLVLNRIGIDVPAVIIPVDVDLAQQAIR